MMLGGQCGSHINPVGDRGESITADTDAVRPKRHPTDDQQSAVVGVKALSKVVRLVDDVDRPRQRQTGAVGNRNAKLACIGLAKLAGREQKGKHPAGHRTLLYWQGKLHAVRVVTRGNRRRECLPL